MQLKDAPVGSVISLYDSDPILIPTPVTRIHFLVTDHKSPVADCIVVRCVHNPCLFEPDCDWHHQIGETYVFLKKSPIRMIQSMDPYAELSDISPSTNSKYRSVMDDFRPTNEH